MERKVILIAGGTGLIGKELTQLLRSQGHEVRLLSRKRSPHAEGLFHWLPEIGKIDQASIDGVQIIINLSGENVGEGRWTLLKKEKIISSRTESAQLLFNMAKLMPRLEQYISASGINAYGYSESEIEFTENAPYGDDYIAQVVQQWEAAADLFQPVCKVAKLRIGVVFSKKGGALTKMALPIKLFVGSPIGSGKQMIPWLAMEDLIRIFDHVIQNQLQGVFNCNNGNVSNEKLTKKIAEITHRWLILPNVPSFMLKLFLGERASLALQGLSASNQKLLESGFQFQENLESCLKKAL